jgi:hypothetical protein
VKTVRALIASTVARAYHRDRHFERFGLLGAATGPVVTSENGYRMPTDLGQIDIAMDFKPSGKVTYNVTVQFVGMQINETNETYDEPYLVVGVVTLAPEFSDDDELDQLVTSQLIQVPGEDHKKDYVFADTQTLWRQGQLVGGTGIKIIVFGYEEDSGDPDEVAKDINAYLKQKTKEGAQAVGAAFGVGQEAGAIADSPELQWFLTVVSVGLAGWVGDDAVGYKSLEIPVSELKKLAAIGDGFPASLKTGPGGIKYNQAVEVSGDGKYTAYFRVSVAEIPPMEIPEPPNP